MRFLTAFIFVFYSQFSFSQNEDLELYYPDEETPPLVLNLLIHVLHYSDKDPRNYTIADTVLIRTQFDLINRFYRDIQPPTLKPPHTDVPFINDSKIRFKISGYQFHTDSVLWDRKWLGWGEKREIDSVILEKNEFLFKTNRAAIFKNRDSIVVLNSKFNNGNYTFSNSYYDGKYTHIEVKEKIKSPQKGGKISYRFGEDNNCSDNLYQKYGRGNDSVLHIFLTCASYNPIAFGCGPSFRYFNMTNMWPANNWAGAQLMAHELGHCLGLFHTDHPQFDDLPRTDKFGWIDCDTISVSNNIMGYNKCRSYLSPKQIAFIHKLYATDKQRLFTTLNYHYNPAVKHTVHGKKVWKRNVILQGDLVVRKNSKLVIEKTVHMPAHATIYLEENATLEINGGIITNMTGKKWKGIVYCKKYDSTRPYKKKGKLITQNGGKLENNTE